MGPRATPWSRSNAEAFVHGSVRGGEGILQGLGRGFEGGFKPPRQMRIALVFGHQKHIWLLGLGGYDGESFSGVNP